MKRKNTIVIAALVNAALLALLFIGAVVSREEAIIDSSSKIANEVFENTSSLYGEKEITLVKEEENLIASEEKENKVFHKLPPEVEQKPEGVIEVVVKRGDSLDKIAKKYDTTVEKIKALNSLKSSFLNVDEKILVPHKDKQQDIQYYVMKCGDNPWTIAMKHHLRVSDLLKLNNLDQERAKKLKPGTKLRIR